MGPVIVEGKADIRQQMQKLDFLSVKNSFQQGVYAMVSR